MRTQTPIRLKNLQRELRSEKDLEELKKELQNKIVEGDKLKKDIRKAIKEWEEILKHEKAQLRRIDIDKKFFKKELRLIKIRFYSHRVWSKEHPIKAFEKMVE